MAFPLLSTIKVCKESRKKTEISSEKDLIFQISLLNGQNKSSGCKYIIPKQVSTSCPGSLFSSDAEKRSSAFFFPLQPMITHAAALRSTARVPFPNKHCRCTRSHQGRLSSWSQLHSGCRTSPQQMWHLFKYFLHLWIILPASVASHAKNKETLRMAATSFYHLASVTGHIRARSSLFLRPHKIQRVAYK